MARDDARLDYFLAALPGWIRGRVEFRHPSWDDDADVYALLERHGAAYCVMSGAGLPCVLRATAPFVYVRLHGPDHEHLYGGSYSDEDLRWWADRIREWQAAGKDVFAYFNNDGGGNAVRNAATLRGLLGQLPRCNPARRGPGVRGPRRHGRSPALWESGGMELASQTQRSSCPCPATGPSGWPTGSRTPSTGSG